MPGPGPISLEFLQKLTSSQGPNSKPRKADVVAGPQLEAGRRRQESPRPLRAEPRDYMELPCATSPRESVRITGASSTGSKDRSDCNSGGEQEDGHHHQQQQHDWC